MTCEEALVLISGQLDGVLTQEEQTQLQTHLETCPQCRQWMRTMQMTDEQLRGMEEEPPAELHHRIMGAVAEETRQKRKPYRLRMGTLAAAAAVALLIGVGGLRMPSRQSQTPETASVMVARTATAEASAEAYSGDESAWTAEAMAAAAQAAADERGAEVALLHQFVPELDACVCQPQTDGSMLYTLSSAEEARAICQTYAAVLYAPVNPDGEAEVSYVLVIE